MTTMWNCGDPMNDPGFDPEELCGTCGRRDFLCECVTCWVCEEHISDDDAREVMPDGRLVHSHDCHGRAVRMAERDARIQAREDAWDQGMQDARDRKETRLEGCQTMRQLMIGGGK